MRLNFASVFVDADSLIYRNAWAAQQTHYEVLFKGEPYLEENLRYKDDYLKFLSEQKDEHKPHFSYRKVEHRLDLSCATRSIDKAIMWCRKRLHAKEIHCFLTDDNKTNNRYDIATILPYKASRGTRPVYYNECRQHIIDNWDTVVVVGEEADDAVVQQQYRHWERLMGSDSCDTDVTCIAHIDKDINMCPGYHWSLDPDKEGLYWITERQGWLNFYLQMLTGDKQVDNIPGLYHITHKQATKKIKEGLMQLTSPKDMYDYVYEVYDKRKPEMLVTVDDPEGEPDMIPWPGTDVVLHEIGNLLWMRRTPGEVWEAPK